MYVYIYVCTGKGEEKTIHPKRGHVDLSLEIAIWNIYQVYVYIYSFASIFSRIGLCILEYNQASCAVTL